MSTVVRPEVSRKNQYYLSRNRYYELKHFCLQYPEWKKSYISLTGLPTRSACVGEFVMGGKTSNPTAVYAEARLYYMGRMNMVEVAAKEAVRDLYLCPLLLKAVTEGLSYEKISPPCCKEVWYTAYRRFFWLLDKARK